MTCCDEQLAPPAIVSLEADERFRQRARELGYDPDNRWVGGYVAYEWGHARWFLDGAFADLAGRRVLEFGCNMGATAVVLGTLGADVEAVDVDPNILELARLNVARHGCTARVRLHCAADSRRLPWSDGHFDAIVCNSVLEYVPPPLLAGTLRELDRLLSPGGVLFVLGTSNRLWPREVHSRWLWRNWVPDRWAGRLWKNPPPRGVGPLALARALGGYRNLCRRDHGKALARAKRAHGACPAAVGLLRLAGALVAPLGLSAGQLTPSMNVVLQKPS